MHVSPLSPHPRARRHDASLRRWVRGSVVILLAGLVVTVVAGPAYAMAEPAVVLAAESIQQVIFNIRAWLLGILLAYATLILTVAAIRYLGANGDPTETDKGKQGFRSAVIGYAIALLAPLLLTIVAEWVA